MRPSDFKRDLTNANRSGCSADLLNYEWRRRWLKFRAAVQTKAVFCRFTLRVLKVEEFVKGPAINPDRLWIGHQLRVGRCGIRSTESRGSSLTREERLITQPIYDGVGGGALHFGRCRQPRFGFRWTLTLVWWSGSLAFLSISVDIWWWDLGDGHRARSENQLLDKFTAGVVVWT